MKEDGKVERCSGVLGAERETSWLRKSSKAAVMLLDDKRTESKKRKAQSSI